MTEVIIGKCRICLADEAIHSIFNSEESIYNNLSKLLGEKIENIDGYPARICEECRENLDAACELINKYNESRKILESGILHVKQEVDFKLEQSDDDDLHSEVEIEIPDTKPVIDDRNIETIEKHRKPRKRIKLKKKIKKENGKIVAKNQTNRVASSLLEGIYSWTGEQWCLSSKVKDLKTVETNIRTKHVNRLKIKKIKVKNLPDNKLCDLCGGVFKNGEKLSMHLKKVHFPQKLYCSHCPKVCSTTTDLKKHIKRKHEVNEKNFICSECGKRFAYKNELTTHTNNVHNKDKFPKKTYGCTFCDKTYACQKSVIIHERSVHTGLRPALCTICDSSFYHEDYLKEHLRLHTGETPFKCPVCGRGYAQRCNMKSHIRIHRISELDSEILSKIRPNYLKLMKA